MKKRTDSGKGGLVFCLVITVVLCVPSLIILSGLIDFYTTPELAFATGDVLKEFSEEYGVLISTLHLKEVVSDENGMRVSVLYDYPGGLRDCGEEVVVIEKSGDGGDKELSTTFLDRKEDGYC